MSAEVVPEGEDVRAVVRAELLHLIRFLGVPDSYNPGVVQRRLKLKPAAEPVRTVWESYFGTPVDAPIEYILEVQGCSIAFTTTTEKLGDLFGLKMPTIIADHALDALFRTAIERSWSNVVERVTVSQDFRIVAAKHYPQLRVVFYVHKQNALMIQKYVQSVMAKKVSS